MKKAIQILAGFSDDCYQGFTTTHDQLPETLQVKSGLYLFPGLKFKCTGIIEGWSYRLPGNNTHQIIEKIELWNMKDNGVVMKRISLMGRSSEWYDYRNSVMTYMLPKPVLVNSDDIFAVHISTSSLVYKRPSTTMDAYYMESYTSSFNYNETEEVAMLPIIIPMLSGTRKI